MADVMGCLQSTGEVVKTPRTEMPSGEPPRYGGKDADPERPTVMGKYRMSMVKSDLLGEGSSSICRKGVDLETGQEVAIKVYKMASKAVNSSEEVRLQKFKRQIQVLKMLQEPFVAPKDETLWHPDLAKATPSKLFMMLVDYSKDEKGEPAPDPHDGVMYVITEVAQYSLKAALSLPRLVPRRPAMRKEAFFEAEAAETMLCTFDSADLRGYVRQLTQLRRKGWREPLGLLAQLPSTEVRPNVICFGAALPGAAGRWRCCWQLLRELRGRLLEPSDVVFNTAISACEKAQAWRGGFALFGLAGCWAKGQCLEAKNGLLRVAWVRALGLVPGQLDAISFGAMVTNLPWQRAVGCLQEVLQRRLEPGGAFRTSLVCRLGHRWRLAISAIGDAGDVGVCNAAMAGCAACSSWEAALALLRSLGDSADLISYSTSISSLEGDGARALQLLAELRDAELRPDARLVGAVLGATSWETGLEILEAQRAWGLETDLVCQNRFLAAAEQQEQWLQATALLRASFAADLVTWNSVLSAMEKRRQWREAFQLLRSLARRAALPDAFSRSSGISAAQRVGRWRSAVELLGGWRPNLVAYNAALAACGTSGRSRWRQGLALREDMWRQRVAPDRLSFVALVSAVASHAAEAEAKAAEVAGLFREMLSAGHPPNMLVYEAALGAFSRAGQHEEITSMLDTVCERGVQLLFQLSCRKKGSGPARVLLGQQDYFALKREKNKPLSRESIKACARAIILVVAGLHAKGLVHLDLKPENLMMFNGRLKLIDVDGCVPIESEVSINDSSISFSPCYCAPEWARFLIDEAENKIIAKPHLDVWSIGVTLCELVTLDAILKPMYGNFLRNGHSHREAGFLFMDWLGHITRAPVPKSIERFDKDFHKLIAEDVPARRFLAKQNARQQLDIRDAKDAKHRESPPVEEAVHEAVQVAAWAQVETRLARAVSLDLADSPAPAELRKRALVTFNARVKGGRCCDAATQTAPAITLSKMYGGIVPHYVQRELARLRQENQLLRYRIASLAMSQPQRSPVRHQATQTAPALTFSTGRVGGHSAVSMTRLPRSTHQVPAAAFEAPPELQLLEASIVAFVRSVEVQTESQASYRRAVIANCKRVAQAVWPRCSLELYGSYASGLGLSSGLDLLLKVHPSHGFSVAEPAEEQVLSPIDEDEEQLRQRNLEEVSPAHSARVRGTHSGWQQQLSDRLAKEKWVVSDSIRVAAHAAIPVLSFAAAPEVKRVSSESEQFMPCSTRVDICLHDAGHRGLRSKARGRAAEGPPERSGGAF
ncbi:unnamed protein product [Effrenium voratum]|nr:unnamed protein product [Effrenium voratum]